MTERAGERRAREAMRSLGLWDGRAPLSLRLASTAAQTNLTYEARTGDRRLALRLPREVSVGAVDRACEEEAQALAFRIGIGVEPVAFDGASGVMATRWLDDAQPLAAQAFARDPALTAEAVALLRRLHASGARLPCALKPAAAIDSYLAGLRSDDRDAFWTPAVARAVARSLAEASGVAAPCHGDPVPANFLRSPRGLVLIDWEYAGMTDPAWDLGYIASEAALDDRAVEAMTAAYGDAMMTPRRVFAAMIAAAAVSALWTLLRLRSEPTAEMAAAFRIRSEKLHALAARAI
ncbi:MAG: hypothetical protein BGP06_00475 [Rhizobiales bacterium 65-9]|nr:phosphotransferase family protein [Hyphomicrobiales bacterium]OJY37247.1 MAG: hypothetical protein BGP06_00475 [Rhizobiales bacterium 65-9]